MITRNESSNRNSTFSYKATNEMLHCDIPNFGENFVAVFTLTITNFTLFGYYLHCVNSSSLNWKQYRFVPEETKQKQLQILSYNRALQGLILTAAGAWVYAAFLVAPETPLLNTEKIYHAIEKRRRCFLFL